MTQSLPKSPSFNKWLSGLLLLFGLLAFQTQKAYGQCPPGAVCATFTAGDIASDYDFNNLGDTSTCIGVLNLSLPAGHWVDSVSTSYDMTAGNGAWLSEQKSWLYSPNTLSGEGSLASGVGNTVGTQSYARSGLNFANTATGTVTIEMHAGRTWGGSGCDASYNQVDDSTWTVIVYHSLAPSCVPPSALQLTSVSGTSADIAWTASATANSYEYELRSSGAAGSGSTGLEASGSVSGTNLSLSGLTATTGYSFYLRSDCGASATSVWTTGLSFTTTIQSAQGISCATGQSAVLFSDDFTTSGNWTGDINQGSGVSNVLWNYRTGGTVSSGTGPSGAHAGSQYIFFESSGSSNNVTTSVITPLIDLTPAIDSAELSFWLHAYGSDIGTLNVGVGTSPTGPFTQVFTNTGEVQTSSLDPWVNVGVRLDSYTGQGIYIEFEYTNGTSFRGDIALDLVEVTGCATCLSPSAFGVTSKTATSADLAWSGPSGSTGFEVSYGMVGFTPGTGSTQTASASPTTISGLNSGSIVDFYVRAICSPGDTSAWTGPITDTIPCQSALSGTYTIDAAQPASATNFISFQEAVGALQFCGVNGPVLFNVANGTYNEQILIGNISGTSATDTIVFRGADQHNTVLSFQQNVSNQRYTVRVNDASYLSFEEMTIEAASGGSFGFAFHVYEKGSHLNFKEVTFKTPISSSSSFAGLVVSGSETSAFTSVSDPVSDIRVEDCHFEGAYYGSRMNGGLSQPVTNVVFKNNTFTDQNRDALYMNNVSSFEIDGNDIQIDIAGSDFGSGIWLTGCDDFLILGNKITNAGRYGIYLTNSGGTSTDRSAIVNNAIGGGFRSASTFTSGIRMLNTSTQYVDLAHNSINMDITSGRGLNISNTSPSNIRLYNNSFVFSAAGASGYAMYVSSESSIEAIDNNNYYSAGNDFVYYGSARADLAALQAANNPINNDANSVSGNPLYAAFDNLAPLGPVLNNAGLPLPQVPIDINGNPRSPTTPDIGAYEFTPVTDDLDLISAGFKSGACLSATDTIVFSVVNTLGAAVDFSVNPMSASWTVSGPINSSGTITVNSGTLPAGDTLTVEENVVDFSLPGSYSLDLIYLDTSSVNQSQVNDTLHMPATIDILNTWNVVPDTQIVVTDTSMTYDLAAESSLFEGGEFFITEISHFRGSFNGAPAGGWPAYMVADDYIEITGVPNSDLGGITLEQWSTTSLTSTHTFPPGTMLSPNGTAIIAVAQLGSSQPSPSDFYYHGNGSYTGSFGSSTSQGRILKDANGNIMDAVAYQGSITYSFPAAANVPSTEWDNTSMPSGTSSAGVRLEGADLNNPTGWIQASTSAQDPNQVNNLVTLPAPPAQPGFSWSLNGVTVSNSPEISVGPFTTPGSYVYVATYNSPCGTFSDSVDIFFPPTGPCVNGSFGPVFVEEFDAQGGWTGDIGTGLVQWQYNSGGTGSPGTGPSAAHSGSNYIFFESSGSSNAATRSIVSPAIDLTAGNSVAELSFWLHAYGASIGTLDVGVGSSATGPFTSVFDTTGQTQTSSNDPWINITADLSAYIGQTIYVEFEYTNGSSFTGDIALDLMEVSTCVACPLPGQLAGSNITASSIDLSWMGNGAQYDITWDTAGFVPGSSMNMDSVSNDTSYQLTGLMANTAYDVYVRNNCNANNDGTSSWVGPVNFRTLCVPFNAPYSNNFDSEPFNQAPVCWDNHLVGGSPQFSAAQVQLSSSFNPAVSAPNYIRLYNYNNDTTWLISPQFGDLSADNKRISFWARTTTTATGNDLVIGTISGATNYGSFTPVDTVDLTNVYQFFEVPITTANGYNGSDEFIVLAHGSASNFRTYYVDDFVYEEIPNCLPPSLSSLGVSMVTSNSADVNWGSGSDGLATRVEWGPVGYTPGAAAIGNATVPGSIDNYVISGLSSQTTYDFYIQDSCSALSILLSEDLRTGAAPSGWTDVNIDWRTAAGGYAKMDPGASLTTASFDGSAFDSVSVQYDVAKFGSGTDGPITLEYSLDGGTTWNPLGDSPTPTSSTYLSGSATINATSATMQVRFTRPNSPSDKRLRDVVIGGIGGSPFSPYVGPFSFTTLCAPFTAPYLENFDGVSATTGDLGNCWEAIPGATNVYSWRSNTGTTGSGSTGPNGDATTGSGVYIYTEASSGSAGNIATLEGPQVDIAGLSNPELRYAYHFYGSNIDTVKVEINDGSGWLTAKTYFGQVQTSSADAWLTDTIDLNAYGDTIQVRFWSRRGTSFFGDLAIDDVVIDDAVNSDLALLGADFLKDGKCQSSNDTIAFAVANVFGGSYDMSTTALVLNYDIQGPISSSASVTVNSGTINPGDTLFVLATGIDLSAAGVYSLDAWIDASSFNASALNDSLNAPSVLEVFSNLAVSPDSVVVISNTTDTVNLAASSNLFSAGDFFITEICHFRGSSTGAPAGGWPSYMTADDYIEITGVPNSDLGGITLEQWSTTSLTSTHTFPPGTLLSPNGTAIIAVAQLGSSQPSPSDFYYHGNGSFTSSFGSATAQGRILKDAAGNIIDAVAYQGTSTYSFPAAANVSSTDWDNTAMPSGSGSAGVRLEGPDLNNPTGWIQSGTSAQDPNQVNNLVTLPAPPTQTGFSWSLNGVTISNDPEISVGPFTSGGTNFYVATYNTNCGTLTDTVEVQINLPLACGTFSAPFIESFEDNSASVGCWTNEQIAGTRDWTTGSGSSGGLISSAYAGAKNAVYASASTTDTTAFISPVLDLSSLNNPELSFWYAQEQWFGDQNHTLIWARPDTNTAWTQLFRDTTDVSAWTQAILTLPNPSSTYQIAIVGINNWGRANVVDSLVIQEGASCSDPDSLMVANISTMGADISWVSGSSASSAYIEYGPVGFAAGTGTVVSPAASPQSLSGLMGGTSYEACVYDICGTDTSRSACIVFSTLCSPINTYPYIEDFEGGVIPNCYTSSTTNGNGIFAWRAFQGPTGSPSTGPSFDRSTGTALGTYLYTEASAPASAGDTAFLDLAQFDLTSLTNPEIAFSYHAYGANIETLALEVWNSTTSTWDTIFSVTGQQQTATTNPWIDERVSLSNYGTATALDMRFTTVRGSSFNGDLALDDIIVREAPACVDPTALRVVTATGNSVSLAWNSDTNIIASTVQYGSPGFTLGTGTNVSATPGNATISGLSSATCYDFYVRDSCSTSTGWIGPVNACTLASCAVTSVPTSITNDTTGCDGGSANLSAVSSSNNDIAWLSNGVVRSVGANYLTDSLVFTTSFDAVEFVTTLPRLSVGPQTSIATAGFGNFTNGTWITVIDTIAIDSMTVRANGQVQAQVQIWDAAVTQVLQRGDVFNTPTGATADYQVPVKVLLTPGVYFMNIDFISATGQLFRSTGGATYPYVLAGLMTMDSINFGSQNRLYYTFDLKVSKACIGAGIPATGVVPGANAGTSDSVAVCANDAAVNLASFLGVYDAGGTWTDDNATGALTDSIFDATQVGANASYNFTYTVSASGNCPGGDTATLTVTVEPVPNAGADSSTAVCQGSGPVVLRNFLSVSGFGGSWADLDQSGAFNTTSSVLNTNNLTAGNTYRFAFIITGNACPSDSAIITVTADAAVSAGMAVTDTVCDDENAVDLNSFLSAGASVGGSWTDITGSGALTGAIFDASAVANMSNYVFQYKVSSACGDDSTTVTLYVDDCGSSLGEMSTGKFEIYPNPTKGMVFIENQGVRGNITVELYAGNGQQLLSRNYESHENMSVDLARYAAGVYTIKVSSAAGMDLKRIVKQN